VPVQIVWVEQMLLSRQGKLEQVIHLP